MSQEKLISFDLRGNFGFFKKPDYNEGILLSYNMLHKPALLGILGAIIGLEGYSPKNRENPKKPTFPEYYEQLKNIPVGLAPLEGFHEKGNFIKSSVKYSNTVGYANKDGNLLVEETMLLNPAYRCFLLISLDNTIQAKLYEYLRMGQAEFIPYLGKNEYPAWWLDEAGNNTFREYNFTQGIVLGANHSINSLFRKIIRLKDNIEETDSAADFNPFEFILKPDKFAYFERLPADFHPQLIQYNLQDYIFSNYPLKAGVQLPNLYFLPELDGYVQLA